MRKNHEKQILNHNIEKFSLMVKDDINMFLFTKILIQANKNGVLQINSISGAKNIGEELK